MTVLVINIYFKFDTQTDSFCVILHMNKYLQYNLTHEQISLVFSVYNLTHKQMALVINNYFKFDTANREAGESEEAVLFLHVYLSASSRKSIIPDSH